MDKTSEREINTINLKSIWNVLIVIIAVLLIGALIFFRFASDTNARRMLREGKNVLLAFNMLSVEYYGRGVSIYDSRHRDGMADGVKDRIFEITEVEGDIFITGYDSSKRLVTGFIYERDNYRVTYRMDKSGNEEWEVDYMLPILKYDRESN